MAVCKAYFRASSAELLTTWRKKVAVLNDFQAENPITPELIRVTNRHATYYLDNWPDQPAAKAVSRAITQGKGNDLFSEVRIVYEFEKSEAFSLYKILTAGRAMLESECIEKLSEEQLQPLLDGQRVVDLECGKLLSMNASRLIHYFDTRPITERVAAGTIFRYYESLKATKTTSTVDSVRRLVSSYHQAENHDTNPEPSIQFR